MLAKGHWSELSSSSIPSYPKELLWNGREPDQEFDPDERLFFRSPTVDERGKLGSVDVVRCPDTSVNRGKYSKPIHVLYASLPKFLGHYVMEFRVRDIPAELEHPVNGKKFQFAIVHDPVKPPTVPDENYAHSEVRAFHNQQRSKIPNLIEKLIRQVLADRMEQVPADRLSP